ncbi:MAG: hypothetical protein MUF18_19660 [Fimbriiglobus sp.]|nr:hypothetical protein [Fimbriiglobus sp.]
MLARSLADTVFRDCLNPHADTVFLTPPPAVIDDGYPDVISQAHALLTTETAAAPGE